MNSELVPILAVVSGDSLINALVWLVVAGLILYVCWWGLRTINPGEPWMKVGTVILVLLTVVIIVNVLLGLVGRPLFKF